MHSQAPIYPHTSVHTCRSTRFLHFCTHSTSDFFADTGIQVSSCFYALPVSHIHNTHPYTHVPLQSHIHIPSCLRFNTHMPPYMHIQPHVHAWAHMYMFSATNSHTQRHEHTVSPTPAGLHMCSHVVHTIMEQVSHREAAAPASHREELPGSLSLCNSAGKSWPRQASGGSRPGLPGPPLASLSAEDPLGQRPGALESGHPASVWLCGSGHRSYPEPVLSLAVCVPGTLV